MTDEEWYFFFEELAQKMFSDFQTYLELLKSGNKKDYLFFESKKGNEFLYKIGHNTLLLKYSINLKDLELSFRTFLIEPHGQNYGSYYKGELDEFEIGVDSRKIIAFREAKEDPNPKYKRFSADRRITDFPATYLNSLKYCLKQSL